MSTTPEPTWDLAKELARLGSTKSQMPTMTEKDLIERVRTAEGHIVAIKKYVETTSERVVTYALDAGNALAELQRQKKGGEGWTSFIETNLKSHISKASIYRYIALANRFPDPTTIPKGLGLTELYALTGIVPVKKPAKKKAAAREPGVGEDFMQRLSAMKSFWTALAQPKNRNAIPRDDRRKLNTEIDELVRVLQEFQTSLREEEEGEGTDDGDLGDTDAVPKGDGKTVGKKAAASKRAPVWENAPAVATKAGRSSGFPPPCTSALPPVSVPSAPHSSAEGTMVRPSSPPPRVFPPPPTASGR